jgi:hypothetical protein
MKKKKKNETEKAIPFVMFDIHCPYCDEYLLATTWHNKLSLKASDAPTVTAEGKKCRVVQLRDASRTRGRERLN